MASEAQVRQNFGMALGHMERGDARQAAAARAAGAWKFKRRKLVCYQDENGEWWIRHVRAQMGVPASDYEVSL